MPTLAQATLPIDETKYERIDAKPIYVPAKGNLPFVDTPLVYTRSPVPPINVSPDTTDNFNNQGRIPQYRIISAVPLFKQANEVSSGTGVTSTTTTTVSTSSSSSSSSSSGGGTTPTTATLSNTAFTTPVIGFGQIYQSSFTLAANFLLVQVSVSSPARVELYSTAAGRAKDSGRPTTAPINLGSETGLIADLNLVASTELTWLCSPIVTGSNGDSPQTSTIYISVTNQTAASVGITVGFVFLSLE